MAHEIATTNGRPAIAYFGELPWHRLGTRLDAPATAAEATTAAGLDFQVDLSPVQTTNGVPVARRKAVVRCDSNDVLGVVGNNYVPIQNHECFSFLDAIVADGGLRYHTAGALGKGERVWMLAQLPGHLRAKSSEDITEKYLLLSNNHDGTAALRVFFTPIRVVCANTLAIAHRRGLGQGIAIQHKGDLASKVREAQRVLGFAQRFYDDLHEQINRLASYYPTQQQISNYFAALYPDPQEGDRRRVNRTRETLQLLFEEGRGQHIAGIRGTAWAALNAVTEYVDHHRPTRGHSPETRAEQRLRSQWFGSGALLKRRAWNLATETLN